MGVEIIKKQKIKAYILLESLIALGILTLITSLILGELDKNRKHMELNLHKQEVLNVATMAVQINQDSLSLNGVHIQVVRKGGQIHIYEAGKKIMQVIKD